MVGSEVRSKASFDKKHDSGKTSATGRSLTDSLHTTLPPYVRLANTVLKKTSKQNISPTDNASLSKAVPKPRKQRFTVTNLQKVGPKTKKVEKKKSEEVITDSSGTLGPKVSWESDTHKLEVNVPPDVPPVHDAVTGDKTTLKNMKNYSEKIDNLIQELGTLKQEVSLQKNARETDEAADTYSHDSLREQFDAMTSANVNEEKEKTNEENEKLRKTLQFMEAEAKDKTVDNDTLTKEKDYMKRKIYDLQQDGKMAARQIYELQEVIRQLRQDNISNSAISQRVTENREDLKYKLTEFEITNESLRQMLQEQQLQNMDNERQREQVESLLLKISEYENRCQTLSVEVLEKDRSINELQSHIQAQMNENSQLHSIVKSLESVKAHLQKQLRSKESELNRFQVQMRNVEEKMNELNMQKDANSKLVSKMNEELEEKEELKKACRIYKQKAEKLEEQTAELESKLVANDVRLFETETHLTHSNSRLSKLQGTQERMSMGANYVAGHIQDLEVNLRNAQTITQQKVTELLNQIEIKNKKITTLETDVEQLKSEVDPLKKTVKEYEVMLTEYKTEMQRCRQEAELTVAQLEHEQMHNSKVQQDSAMELQQLKDRLQTRLRELEPLPALLEQAETKLQATYTKLSAYEERNHENTNLISELTTKLETQYDELMNTHDHTRSTTDQNRSLLNQNESNERKLTELESRNRDLTLLLNEREQTIASSMSKVEELSIAKIDLQSQLEHLQSDIKLQAEKYREKSAHKDRTNQVKTNDLQKEVEHLKTETACLIREKDENALNMKKCMADLNERLEQSYNTNRSLNNYLAFLKQSYGNVFGDVLADVGSCPNHTPLPLH